MSIDRPLHVLTLATLFPNELTPNFGIFVERQTAELTRRPQAKVTIINPLGIPPWPLNKHNKYAALGQLAEHENWHGLDVHRPRFTLIPAIGATRNPQQIAKAILPLVQQLHQQTPFDIIDAEFFFPDGPAAMLLAAALDIPFTIKARGSDIHYWAEIKHSRKQIFAAADQAAGLLAVSAALRQDMAALGIDAQKISVHYTGIDQEKFKPADRMEAKKQLGVSGPLFITTGALIAGKNQNLVIEAMAHLPEATLLLAGSGPQEAAYRQLTQQLNLSNRVHFLGNVAHDAMPQLTAAADIAILVSKAEGLANAWVEALACGTPLVISEAGGARELITNDQIGRIVAQDSNAIAAAVREILANPPSQAVVRQSVAHFSWQNNGDQLLAFLTSAAGR